MIKELSHDEYEVIRDMLLQHSGILLSDQKKVMIQSRLHKRLNKLGLQSYGDYLSLVSRDTNELTNFVNSLTTNKTELFRESDHFKYVTEVLIPREVKALNGKPKTFYIWSAACSAGDEVYTLAIVMEELKKKYPNIDYRVLGSDIDTDILHKAENRAYDQGDLSSVDPSYVPRYFTYAGGNYVPSMELKSKIKFRQFNLVNPVKPINLTFDFIFLRNVLIYFPPDVIQRVIDNLTPRLKPQGHFFVGHSETLNGITTGLKSVGPAIYVKKS